MFKWLRKELSRTPKRQLGALLAKGAFLSMKQRVDPETHGGAPLLGLNGNVVIAHGSSREHAIMNGIGQAVHAIQHKVNDLVAQDVGTALRLFKSGQRTASISTP
jgi:glycerol-3-phosphate acyltransferase PlsX